MRRRRWLVGLWMAGMGFMSAFAQAPWSPAEDARQRTQIQSEREAAAQQKQQAEALCYQRFAVEDCLQQVRRKHRQQESRLRKQEVRLNEARRLARNAERQKALAASQAEVAHQSAPPVHTQLRKSGCEVPDCQDALRAREAQARERAQAQAAQRQAHEAQAQQRQTARERQAATARERQRRLEAEVEVQRSRRAQAQAQSAAQGKKPAAPLPQRPPPVLPAP